MKTFAFVPQKSITKLYGSFLHKYRRYDDVIELLKVGTLAFVLVFCVFCYLYLVNMSSTRGYFLRQENQKLSSISFQFEILKTKMLEYKQYNWDTVQSSSFRRDVVDVSAEVVKLPQKVELGYLGK
jgi:amino acid permease